MASNKKPRKAYRPGKALVSPMIYAMSHQASRELATKDRLVINSVISGAASRDDLAGVEMIAVSQIHMARLALASPAAHQVDAEPLREMLSRLEQVIAPAIHGIVQHYHATGQTVCSDAERAALLDLADIADETLAALPRRLIADGYRAAVKNPVIRLEVAA